MGFAATGARPPEPPSPLPLVAGAAAGEVGGPADGAAAGRDKEGGDKRGVVAGEAARGGVRRRLPVVAGGHQGDRTDTREVRSDHLSHLSQTAGAAGCTDPVLHQEGEGNRNLSLVFGTYPFTARGEWETSAFSAQDQTCNKH